MKTDKQQKNAGKVVKVGIDQLQNDTPVFMKWVFRIILYLSVLYAMAIQPNLDLPVDIQALINKWLLAANAFIHVTTKFFGWDHPKN